MSDCQLIAVKGINKLKSAMIVVSVSVFIIAGCAAPAGMPSGVPAGVEQNVQNDDELDNGTTTYAVVDGSATLDAALANSAYMLVPAPDSLDEILEDLDRTTTGNIGVLVPYEVGVVQGLNGSIVVPSASTELPGHPGTLTFNNSLSAEFDDKSLLLEYEVVDSMTDTAQANVTVDIIGSFPSTDSLPDLGSISAFSPTIIGEWDDYCIEHPTDCHGAQGNNLGVCCYQWSWEQLKYVCGPGPCPKSP